MRQTHQIQGLSVDEIAAAFGTPMFLYDADAVISRFRQVRETLHPELQIFYSLKANPNISIYSLLHSMGARAEVSSMAELATVLQCKTSPDDIIYLGPGKSSVELEVCVKNGIFAIVCESFDELAIIDELGAKLGLRPNVALRVNPAFSVKGSRLTMGGKPRQFGIDEAQIMERDNLVKEFPNVTFKGIHIYSGTRILAWDEVVANSRRIFEFAETFSTQCGFPLEMVDIGGGLGVPYFDDEAPLDLAQLGRELNPLIAQFRAKHPTTRLIMELGRYLVAESGMLVSKALYVKESMGDTFVITDGGTNCHMAAVGVGSFVKRNFPMGNLSDVDGIVDKTYHVTGPLCTPNDVIGKAVKLAKVEAGDLIGVRKSGAYGPTASPVNFLSFGYPSEVMVHQSKAILIRERDGVADLLRKQRQFSFTTADDVLNPPEQVEETRLQASL